ncbi:MAG: DUF2846 domain-containing protein [bacterium]|nr:DUF2846 domain-containing protein [bacterium]
MKLTIQLLAISLLLSVNLFAQDLPSAPDDKAVVYFARPSSLGLAIKFTYYDSATLIGKFNAPKYFRYECEPGKHLFWARAENRSFVEADLQAGKIYLIEAVPKMGAVKAGVVLVPIDPSNTKRVSKIMKLINKRETEVFTDEDIARFTSNNPENSIQNGLDRYQQLKGKNKDISQLNSNMSH